MNSFVSDIKNNLRSMIVSAIISFVAALPLILVFVFVTLPIFEEQITKDKKSGIQSVLTSVYGIFSSYQEKVNKKILTLEEAQNQAKEQIRSLRYGSNDYFFIVDTNKVIVMHPFKPEFEKKDSSDIKDPNNFAVFAEVATRGSKNGEGFVEYEWPRGDEKKPIAKISFYKLYKPWNWVISTGVYVDDIEKATFKAIITNLIWFSIAILFSLAISLFFGIRHLQKLIIPIQNIIIHLSQESQDIQENSEQVSRASDALAQTSFQHSSAIQETAAAVTELSQMAARTAENAHKSTLAAQETKHQAAQGQNAIKEMVEAIAHISQSNEYVMKAIEKNNENILSLSKIMEDIQSKTQVINSIVFQTKLLSFNASVESARAGEAGKGFSVVASEIGKLAEMSGNSAKEISSIIEISKETVKKIAEEAQANISSQIDENKKQLQIGHHVVAKCRSVLDEVFGKATESTEMINEISIAGREQQTGIQEISKAMETVEQLTKSDMVQLEATSQSAKNLQQRVTALNELVSSLQKLSST
ncbi:MAG: cache domain-containing protein [Silvanigrellaceae bacterium]|nr:cache domain-containing protein [Silvanigrellaceae bacterium]